MKRKYQLESEVFLGQFDANKDYFTHTEWVKAGTGFGFVLGVFVSICIWFLMKI